MLEREEMMGSQCDFEKKLRHELASIQASVDFVCFALRRSPEKNDARLGALLHSANESLNAVIHQLDNRNQPVRTVDGIRPEGSQ